MMMNQGMMNNGSSFNDMNSMGFNQSMSPMAFQNYNNVAAASFYSHQPFGSNSGYLNSFGNPGGGFFNSNNQAMIRTPMEQAGYGSYTLNFNRNPQMGGNQFGMQPTFYSDQQPFI